MFLGYDQVTVSSAVLTVSSFTVPAAASLVEIQATEQAINYTMDASTNPTATATGVGMRLAVGDMPKQFLIEDFRRIRVIRAAGSDGKINVHYSGGRDI